MKPTGILDIFNSIAVFQLIFFSVYLFVKGNRIPSTIFLKIYMLFQLLAYTNYIYWSKDIVLVRPVLIITMPSMCIWSPSLYFYIHSRLYKNFIPSWKLLIHATPAAILMIYILLIFTGDGNIAGQLVELRQRSYYIIKIQILAYNLYSLYIIYRYRTDIRSVTSADEKQKLNWLFFITYGYALTSLGGMVMYTIPGFKDFEWGYVIFWIFLNFFFFKAILHPDLFLGIEEKHLVSVRLSESKGSDYFTSIEQMINSKQLYLDPELSLHNVALAVKLSDRVVSQAIRQKSKVNFSDYINKKRIEYAKEVLRNTSKSEKNVLEILYEAGFNSKSVFNNQFKKHTGQSPTSFREINQEKNSGL